MNPFRCSNCNKLLGMIEGKAEIKCPKCKKMNRYTQDYGGEQWHASRGNDSTIVGYMDWRKLIQKNN